MASQRPARRSRHCERGRRDSSHLTTLRVARRGTSPASGTCLLGFGGLARYPQAPPEFGRFGVDGTEPGVGPAVVGVPFLALVDLGAEFVEVSLAAVDGGFGLPDVVGEAVDLVEDRRLLVAAMAAELGERAEFAEPLLGDFQTVIGPVQVLLG